MIFFWGFKTNAVVNKDGICLVEKTLPNNITDSDAAFSLIKELKRRYRFKKGDIFIADKAYDVRELYFFDIFSIFFRYFFVIFLLLFCCVFFGG